MLTYYNGILGSSFAAVCPMQMYPVSLRKPVSLSNLYMWTFRNDGVKTWIASMDAEGTASIMHDGAIIIRKIIRIWRYYLEVVFLAWSRKNITLQLNMHNLLKLYLPERTFWRRTSTYRSRSCRLCSWTRPKAWKISCCIIPLYSHPLPMLIRCSPWPTIPKYDQQL